MSPRNLSRCLIFGLAVPSAAALLSPRAFVGARPLAYAERVESGQLPTFSPRRHVVTASADGYSMADQKARFAKQQADNNARALNLESMYEAASFKGKRVLVTGGNRGLGLAIVKELAEHGAEIIVTTRSPSPELEAVGAQVIDGIDVTTDSVDKLATAVSAPIDVLINNAGYFYGPVEKIDSLNFEEELKMIDICALGPLRVTAALFNAGKLTEGAKVAMITSQGGSIAWRETQNPTGHDYGHHMSKAAANMMSKLLSQELKSKGITVTVLHPGFNKTEMTKKYEAIWAEEGAVDPAVGAKRVLHEIHVNGLDKTGVFINCEDGLQIPW